MHTSPTPGAMFLYHGFFPLYHVSVFRHANILTLTDTHLSITSIVSNTAGAT